MFTLRPSLVVLLAAFAPAIARGERASNSDTIVVLGDWPRHGVYLAGTLVSREAEEPPDRYVWSVLPAGFSSFEPTHSPADGEETLGGRDLDDVDGATETVHVVRAPKKASSSLRRDLAALRTFLAGGERSYDEIFPFLRERDVRILERHDPMACGLDARDEQKRFRVWWSALGEKATVVDESKTPHTPDDAAPDDPGPLYDVREASGCHVLPDRSVVLVTSSLALGTGSFSEERTEAALRLKPPPGALPPRGWLAKISAKGQELVPVGFSRAGRFAWVEIASGGTAIRLTVTDLVSDAVVAKRSWHLAEGGDVNAVEGEILREAQSSAIEPPLPLSREDSPEGLRLAPVAGGGRELQLRTGPGRSKRVAALDTSKREPVVDGVVRSPFEPRLAIVVSWDEDRDGFVHRARAAFGAHLTAGFGR